MQMRSDYTIPDGAPALSSNAHNVSYCAVSLCVGLLSRHCNHGGFTAFEALM